MSEALLSDEEMKRRVKERLDKAMPQIGGWHDLDARGKAACLSLALRLSDLRDACLELRGWYDGESGCTLQHGMTLALAAIRRSNPIPHEVKEATRAGLAKLGLIDDGETQ